MLLTLPTQQSDRFRRHDQCGRGTASACALTIATMAIDHSKRWRRAFIANCTTSAATEKRHRYSIWHGRMRNIESNRRLADGALPPPAGRGIEQEVRPHVN